MGEGVGGSNDQDLPLTIVLNTNHVLQHLQKVILIALDKVCLKFVGFQIAAVKGIHTINIVRQRPNFDELKNYLTSLGSSLVIPDSELR